MARQNCQESRTITLRVPGGWRTTPSTRHKSLVQQGQNKRMFRDLQSQTPLTRSRKISGAMEALNAAQSPKNCAASLDHPAHISNKHHKTSPSTSSVQLGITLLFPAAGSAQCDPWSGRCSSCCSSVPVERGHHGGVDCELAEKWGKPNNLQSSAIHLPSPSTSHSLRLDHLLLGKLVRQPIPEPTLVCGPQPSHMMLDDGTKSGKF